MRVETADLYSVPHLVIGRDVNGVCQYNSAPISAVLAVIRKQNRRADRIYTAVKSLVSAMKTKDPARFNVQLDELEVIFNSEQD